MDRNAYRDENDTDQPDSYWRRRVITLAAGLSLLGVLAWAFSGGGGKPASPSPRNSQASSVLPAAAYSGAPTAPASGASQTGSAQAGRAIPGLPSALPAPASGSSRTAGGASASATSRTRQSALGQPGATSTGPAVPPAGGGPGPGGRCSPSAMVLSLFTRPEYYGGQYPQFAVYAVSTASGACSLDVGPGHLHVIVMSAGRIIWDSADCSRGEPNRVAELRRGVPAQESVSWNRSVTLPGCVTLASSARPGTYQVQAKSATVSSPVRTFKLVRLPLADV
jgi:hypothetical protein